MFLIEAARFNVLPLDDRAAERADPDLAGRPVLARGRRQRLYKGIGRLNAFSVISIKNKSHDVTAEVVVPAGGADGVIVAQGGFVGGWAIYAKDGRPMYCYNFYGVDLLPRRRNGAAARRPASGPHVVRVRRRRRGQRRDGPPFRRRPPGRRGPRRTDPAATVRERRAVRDRPRPRLAGDPRLLGPRIQRRRDLGRDRAPRGFAGQRRRDLRQTSGSRWR